MSVAKKSTKLVALLGNESLDGLANLSLATKHGLKVDGFELADINLAAVRKPEFLLASAFTILSTGSSAGLERHAKMFMPYSTGSTLTNSAVFDDIAVEIRGGGRLHDHRVGKHGAQQHGSDSL